MKQAIKKGSTIKKPTISEIKEKLGLTIKKKEDLVRSSAIKQQEFIPMPKAFVDATKLPGIPMGVLTLCLGHSNTGKSSLKNALIASCIDNGIMPVLFETENSWSWKHAMDCGVKATPIYGEIEKEIVDEETGEVSIVTEEAIIDYDSDLVYYDSPTLASMYGNNDYSTGTKKTTFRKDAVIEDIAYAINDILDMQDRGEIQQPICFIWDSVGSIQGWKSFTSKTGNNMFDAGSVSTAFNNIINSRIPSSRKVSSPYTNTLFFINKVWIDSMTNPMAAPSLETKNGKSLTYGARLKIILGGALKASTKRLTATAKGENYHYGLLTKIKVDKNHLDSPYNITYEGSFCCVPNGIVGEDELDAYKKSYIKEILKQLENNSNGTKEIKEEDVKFTETEVEGDE